MEIPEERARESDHHGFGLTLSKYGPALVLAAASLFFAYDIVADLLDDSESTFHIVVEGLVFVAISGVLLAELRRVGRLQSAVRAERAKTARLTGELLAVMRSQFEAWELSPSESEVALLLIKGLSMREISAARDVKEKTVRQQATSIYAKTGCAGRHELAAYFIEDLLSQDQASDTFRAQSP
ncbi:MAG: helix-turn-helix transcriptional regulator [Chromatiales bacterium]|nr:MAG: helix-turn-helix transcriptional regulator [Chromatiales bacterium]